MVCAFESVSILFPDDESLLLALLHCTLAFEDIVAKADLLVSLLLSLGLMRQVDMAEITISLDTKRKEQDVLVEMVLLVVSFWRQINARATKVRAVNPSVDPGTFCT